MTTEPTDPSGKGAQDISSTQPEAGYIEPTNDAVVDKHADEDSGDDDTVRKLKRECQQLRSRLRDSEEQIGAAAAREAIHQRAVIEHAAQGSRAYRRLRPAVGARPVRVHRPGVRRRRARPGSRGHQGAA